MNIDKEKLQAQLPPPSEAFMARMRGIVEHLPEKKEEIEVKRKLSVGLVLALAAVLLTMGIAAAAQWDVLEFLFGGQEKDAADLVQPVAASAEAAGVVLDIASALTDGEYLAFDWRIVNQMPESPAYVQVEAFTAEGVALTLDGTDDFDCQWLPGWCNDGAMQDGEVTVLPAGDWGNRVEICMTVGVYRPKQPVWQMDAFDAAEAQAQMDAGYYVLAEGDGLVVALPEEGVTHVYGRISRDDERYDRAEMTVHFVLDLTAARAAIRDIPLPEETSVGSYAVRWEKLTVSPLALQAVVTLTPESGERAAAERLVTEGAFCLRGGDGQPMDEMPILAETCVEEDEAGHVCTRTEVTYLGWDEAAMPETITLMWSGNGGEEMAVGKFSMQ